MTSWIRRLPKVELHVHLDGSLRMKTVRQWARELPPDKRFANARALRKAVIPSGASGLEEYLKAFDVTVALLQTPDRLRQAAYELCEDAAAENVVYIEIRFAPLLHTEENLNPREVVLAVLRGLQEAKAAFGIEARLILSAMKQAPTEDSMEVAQLAAQFGGKGVVAMDLAGPERLYPPQMHRDAIDLARESGVHVTIHAGEGCCPEQIRTAIDLGAERIGHGVHLFQAPETEKRVAKLGIPLEMCPTSNLQVSGCIESYAAHPFKRYSDLGIPVTINTDNRLMSQITLTHEYQALQEAFSFTRDDIRRFIENGIAAAFAPDELKASLHQRVEQAFAAL
ncbi:adenosine deaminase [Candidatus Bipolaricaulota bacterium]|nr:adenosine deaminase [Candidatus Bipolaricaulota bacterium]